MTTIAACLVTGVMAADSTWTDGTERGIARKVWRVRHELIGLAGDLCELEAWIHAYKAGDKPKGKPYALRLSSTGLAVWTSADGWTPIRERQWAIGSGAAYASGAMAFGATPAQAVRFAITKDVGSGGRVRTYRLDTRR